MDVWFILFFAFFLLNLLCPVPVAGFHWNRLEPVSISTASPVVTLATPAGVPSDTGFVQLQAHLGPDQPAGARLSLSTLPDFGPLHTASGRHTGLIALNASAASLWYLRADNLTVATIGANATAWILFAAKAWDEPIPGGCDLTSPVANPPGLAASQLLAPGVAWRLGYALAGSFDAALHVKVPCNASLRKANLRYRLYALALRSYATDDWRAGLERMATAQEAVVYGRLLTVEGADGKPPSVARFDIGARPGAPVMYTVVVEQTDTGQFSAYVPAMLDYCDGGVDGGSDALSRCVLGAEIEWRVTTIVAAIVGLFLCTMGFRFFTLSVLICGFSAGALLVLPATLRTLASSPEQRWLAYLLGAGAAGLLVALVALAVWLKCRSTVLALLFVHVPCCWLLACAAFATPFGRLWWVMREEYIFFLTLTALLLLSLLLLLFFSNAGAIFSLSLVGTFTVCTCVSANLLIGSVFPYMFLDLFRRTVYRGYNQVHLYFVLHQTVDWILLVAWLASALLCCLLQYCWNRRAMDPAVRGARYRASARGSLDELPSGSGGGGRFDYAASERTPLLRQVAGRGSPPPGYTIEVVSNSSR